MSEMFTTLQELPILMGMGKQDMLRMVELVKLDFKKYSAGTTFITQGDRCDRLIYVLSGEVCTERRGDSGSWIISEYLTNTPVMLEAENLWGMSQRFLHSYTMTADGGVCSIEKQQLGSLIANYDVVRTNMLGYICNKLERTRKLLFSPPPTDSREKLLKWLQINCLTTSGKKVVHVRMDDLAALIADTRLNVSRVLNAWKDQGAVEIKRGFFVIKDMEQLFVKKETL